MLAWTQTLEVISMQSPKYDIYHRAPAAILML